MAIVPFSFGISENTVFSNVIDSYHMVDERYIRGLTSLSQNNPETTKNL
jgi:hypothetical protein